MSWCIAFLEETCVDQSGGGGAAVLCRTMNAVSSLATQRLGIGLQCTRHESSIRTGTLNFRCVRNVDETAVEISIETDPQ